MQIICTKMKVLIKLDKRKLNAQGKFPIKFYFSEGSVQHYVSSGMFSAVEDFNEFDLFSLKDVKTRNENRRNNMILSDKLEQANALLYDLTMKGKTVSPKQFADMLFRKTETVTFYSFYEEFAERKTGGTKDRYSCTLIKLRKFYKEVYFEDIDYRFLIGFENKCVERGNRVNTIAIDMRNIRAVYNEAMKMRLVSRDLYPFHDYKVRREETEHRTLELDQLKLMFSHEGTNAENYARDCAKLIFMLIGINISDLYDLQAPVNGYIRYRRNKTGKIYEVKLEPEMQPLFERFKGVKSFLCFSEQFKNCHELTKKINGTTIHENLLYKKGLNSIASELGLEKITSYYMRHTWGTIAGELDIPKETISKALGHGRKDVTDIYVKFNQRKIDEANRKIMDLVFG